MKDNRYTNIIVYYGDADRDILTKQIKMYRERYQSKNIIIDMHYMKLA